MSAITTEQIKRQSENVIRQFGELWKVHAKENSKHEMKSIDCFKDFGVGRAILCVANGYSFEHEIETIKEHAHNVDIICCDKTLGTLINHGIKPTFCMVADANVNYEKYMKPWEDKLGKTVLFMNVCGNPKWADNGTWKDKFFLVNKDVLKSEKIYQEISGCPNVIPAGTNVSNAMLIVTTQCDNHQTENFMSYDKTLLIGYDYSWSRNGSYYAFDKLGGGKYNYMRHINAVEDSGDLCFTSTNLSFSAKWLTQYINVFKLPVVQCTKKTLLILKNKADLKSQMQYRFRPEDSQTKIMLNNLKKTAEYQLFEIKKKLANINKEHKLQFMQTI
jgi:hypothetical protein